MEKRFGRQEPTVRFTLPYKSTKGSTAIELYEQSGRTAMEWQRGLIYDIMAWSDEQDNWVHASFGLAIPRQNGKNECISIREIYALFNGERVLHTAHRTATSRAAWERLVSICEAAGIHEIKGENRSGFTSGKSKGQEWIQFDAEHGGGKVSFRTRSTTGGLGETYDVLIIDEAQEYQDDQRSALQYTIATSEHPQTLYLGTPPTPYSSGTIFPKFRKDILAGTRKNSGWAEWSVEEMTAPHNVDAWYETNPSLGYKIRESTIEEELGDDVVDFNIQRLGLWIRYNQQSAISKTEWEALAVEKLPRFIGKFGVGCKFSKDGSSVSLSVAIKTDDGRIFVETIANHSMRDGVDWLANFMCSAQGACKMVADGSNGLAALNEALKNIRCKEAYQPTVNEIIEANADFEQCVFQKLLTHMVQPSVVQIVSNCEKRAIGSNGGFGYKSTNTSFDVSILDSIILAVWCVKHFDKQKKTRVSY